MINPTIEFKTKNKKKLKFELDKNKIKVEGPDPQGFLAEVLAAGGIEVNNGERFDLKLKLNSQKVEFKFDSFQSLKEIKGPDVVLRCTATDASGNTATVDVSPDCAECKGGVTSLMLQNNGSAATITVQDEVATYFSGLVAAGATFTLNGTKADGKFEKNELDVLIDNVLNTTIHVSCSQPINPGLSFGAFTVVEAISKDNGNVCPLGGASATTSAATFEANEDVLQLDAASSVPEQYYLDANYPNPFNPSTTISFGVPEAAEVKLAIYNLRGQLIQTLHSGIIAAGQHSVVWDGKDAGGSKLASGIYLYQLRANDFVATKKLVFTK